MSMLSSFEYSATSKPTLLTGSILGEKSLPRDFIAVLTMSENDRSASFISEEVIAASRGRVGGISTILAAMISISGADAVLVSADAIMKGPGMNFS